MPELGDLRPKRIWEKLHKRVQTAPPTTSPIPVTEPTAQTEHPKVLNQIDLETLPPKMTVDEVLTAFSQVKIQDETFQEGEDEKYRYRSLAGKRDHQAKPWDGTTKLNGEPGYMPFYEDEFRYSLRELKNEQNTDPTIAQILARLHLHALDHNKNIQGLQRDQPGIHKYSHIEALAFLRMEVAVIDHSGLKHCSTLITES